MNLIQKMYYLGMMVSSIRSLSQISKNNKCNLNFRQQKNQTELIFISCRASESNGLTFHEITDQKSCWDMCCYKQGQNLTLNFQQCLKPKFGNQDSFDVIQLASNFILFIICLVTVATIIYGMKRLYKYMVRKYGKQSRQLYKQITEDIVTKSLYSIIWLKSLPKESNEVDNSKDKQQFADLPLPFNSTLCDHCKNTKINIETVCGHCFHTECFHKWLQTHSSCPKCPNTPLYYIKLYCTNCSWYYLILDIDYYKKLGPISLDCNNCLTKEEFKNKVVKYYWTDCTSQQTINRKQSQ